MNGTNKNKRCLCILLVILLLMTGIQTNAVADGESIFLKGISTRKLAETGEIGLSVSATNSDGVGVSIKPTDLQVQINGQPVEATIDRESTTGHIFVVDCSLSPEGKRWVYATEATENMISGFTSWMNVSDEVNVIWVGEENQVETMPAGDMQTAYKTKRENARKDTAHLYDGISKAIELAEAGAGGYDYYNIYIVSDGLDNESSASLDNLRRNVQDSNSPLSFYVCCYHNGSQSKEVSAEAEKARKELMQFTMSLDGAYESFDIQKIKDVGNNVKHALNAFSNSRYGLTNVRVALNEVQLDRINGQTEIYVGLVSGGTAKRKTIYLKVDDLPVQMEIETAETRDFNAIIAEKDEQIETLVSGAALKDAEISALKKIVEEQTSKINSLEGEFEEKQKAVETLESDNKEKADRIEALEDEKVVLNDRVDELENAVTDQTAIIESVETENTELRAKVNALDADVKEKEFRIEALEADAAERASEIETLKDDVEEKDNQITTLAAELSAKISEVGALQESIEEKNAEIDAMTETVTKKDAQINDLESEAAEREAEIIKLTANNRSQEAQLQIFKQKILDEGIAAGYDGVKSLKVIVPTKEYVVECLSSVPDIAAIDAVTIDNDPNGQLGKDGQYIEQIYFSSPLVNPDYADHFDIDVIGLGTSCGGSVEVYRTIGDAEKRNQHLAYYDGTDSSTGSHVVVGTMVIRTSSKLPLVEQKKIENEIIVALTDEEP